MGEDHRALPRSVEHGREVARRRRCRRGNRLVGLHDPRHEQPQVREPETEHEHQPPPAEHRAGPDGRWSLTLGSHPRPQATERSGDRGDRQRERQGLPRGHRDPDPARDERSELHRLLEPHEERDEQHGRRVAERHRGAAQRSSTGAVAEPRRPPRPEQQPDGERRHGEQRDAELHGRGSPDGGARTGQPRHVDVEIAFDHEGNVMERSQVQRTDPERAGERHTRICEHGCCQSGYEADRGDRQEDQESSQDRARPSRRLVTDRRPGTRPGHDKVVRTSWATSVGVRPTRTSAASSASALACAVPLEPVMIAPAWPIRLPGGAVNPAM